MFIAGHGAPGLIEFPDGDHLAATELMDAIAEMHKNNWYKEMVIFIESCQSGSMFHNLPKNINGELTSYSEPL